MSPEAKRGPPSSVLSTLNWRFSPASHRPAERVRKSLKGPPGRITEQISLDSVIQAPGGRDEDGAYAHGGWAMPYFDTAMGEAIAAAQGRSFDLLLGRRTYEIFTGYWPKVENPIADGLNAATKYAATHRPTASEGVRSRT